jgi:hypothetical protein
MQGGTMRSRQLTMWTTPSTEESKSLWQSIAETEQQTVVVLLTAAITKAAKGPDGAGFKNSDAMSEED